MNNRLKTWAGMSDAEKGALLLAQHMGKPIELWVDRPDSRLDEVISHGNWLETTPSWSAHSAYRVKPEPVLKESNGLTDLLAENAHLRRERDGARDWALEEAASMASVKCDTCGGTGKVDDAESGDITFNTWPCRTCGGSGEAPNPAILALRNAPPPTETQDHPLVKMPPEIAPKHAPVLVSGGIAMMKSDGKWYSGMSDEPFTRELNWSPQWWACIPQDNDPPAPCPEGDGVAAIAVERRRQVEAEGWSPEHDDQHTQSELADAALSYLQGSMWTWPSTWAREWWKPRDRRSNLVRAGALIAAEIDRLDRRKP